MSLDIIVFEYYFVSVFGQFVVEVTEIGRVRYVWEIGGYF
jgi:hypothetical protein